MVVYLVEERGSGSSATPHWGQALDSAEKFNLIFIQRAMSILMQTTTRPKLKVKAFSSVLARRCSTVV